jgi:hypothetical protein
MSIKTIGLLSPGDLQNGVAKVVQRPWVTHIDLSQSTHQCRLAREAKIIAPPSANSP